MVSIPTNIGGVKPPRRSRYGKHRDGAPLSEGKTTLDRSNVRWLKSVMMEEETARRLHRAFGCLGYVMYAEVRRDHHLLASETEKRFYVRFLVDEKKLPPAPVLRPLDLRLQRALNTWHEFLVTPSECAGRFEVLHYWSDGGGNTHYLTDHHSCTCEDHQCRRGIICKHIWRVRLEYPLPRVEVSRDVEMDFP